MPKQKLSNHKSNSLNNVGSNTVDADNQNATIYTLMVSPLGLPNGT